MSWYDIRLNYTWWENTGRRALKATLVISPLILSCILFVFTITLNLSLTLQIITATMLFISTAIIGLIPIVLRIQTVTFKNSYYYLDTWFKSPFQRYLYPYLIKTQEDDIGRHIAWVALIEYDAERQEYKVDLSDTDLFVLTNRLLKKVELEDITREKLDSLMAKVLLEEDCFEHFHKIERTWKKF